MCLPLDNSYLNVRPMIHTMSLSKDTSLGFTKSDLNDDFFSKVGQALGIKLTSWSAGEGNKGFHLSSDLGDILGNQSQCLSGVFKYSLEGVDNEGKVKCHDVAVRSKYNNEKNSAGWVSAYTVLGEDIHEMAMKYWMPSMNFSRASELETLTAKWAMKNAHLAHFLPDVHLTILDKAWEKFVVVTDFIGEEDILIGGDPQIKLEPWTDEMRFKVLREMAKFHSKYLANYDGILEGFGDAMVKQSVQHLAGKPWWYKVLDVNAAAYPDDFSPKRIKAIRRYLDNLEDITDEIMAYPMTFVHNDMHQGNPINITLI